MKPIVKPIAASKGGLKALAALSVVAGALSMVAGANAHAAQPGAPSGQFYMGVAAHLSESDPGRAGDGKTMAEIALTEMGAVSLRDEASWEEVDDAGAAATAKRFKVIGQNGGKMMLLLDYSNAKYVQGGAFPNTTAERKAFLEYANKIIAAIGPENLAAIEIWNEWSIYLGWFDPWEMPAWDAKCPDDPNGDGRGCPVMYAKLVETLLYPEREGLSVPSLRQAAPGVPVLGHAIEARDRDWTLASMQYLRDHNVQIDGAVVHPYVAFETGCGTTNDGPVPGAQKAMDCLAQAAQDVADGYGKPLPMWVTEAGWSRAGGRPVTADVQARILVEFYVKARASGLTRGVWWYDLQDDIGAIDDSVGNMGLVSRGAGGSPGTPYPAGKAFSALAHFWADCSSVTGSYAASNRTFQASCADGSRQIILAATATELTQASAAGATLVDLLGQQADVPPKGNTSPLAGHPVGIKYDNVATTYTVTASAGAGGAISPAGAVSVNAGATQSFTVTPNSGYSIASVGGSCGGSLNGNTYTTSAITANCTVSAAFAGATNHLVTVYEHINRGGKSKTYDQQGLYQTTKDTLGMANDSISSIEVHQPISVTLYDDDYGSSAGGRQIYFPKGFYNLTDYDFNDLTSAISVDSGQAAVILFEHINEEGQTIAASKDTYQPNLVTVNFNDKASSVFVPSGLTVTLYQDIDYGGETITFGEGVYNLTNYRMRDGASWNDQVSSYVVR